MNSVQKWFKNHKQKLIIVFVVFLALLMALGPLFAFFAR